MTSIRAKLKLGTLATIFLFIPCTLCQTPNKSKIAAELKKIFNSHDHALANVVLKFKGNPAKVLERFSLTARSSSQVDVNQMHLTYINELKEMRNKDQAKVLDFLDKPSVLDSSMQHSSCWMTNEIFVKRVNKDLLTQLAKFDEIESIHKEQMFRIHKPLEEGPVVDESRIVEDTDGNKSVTATEPQWNIMKINAEEAQKSSGTKGEGVTVGIIGIL